MAQASDNKHILIYLERQASEYEVIVSLFFQLCPGGGLRGGLRVSNNCCITEQPTTSHAYRSCMMAIIIKNPIKCTLISWGDELHSYMSELIEFILTKESLALEHCIDV